MSESPHSGGLRRLSSPHPLLGVRRVPTAELAQLLALSLDPADPADASLNAALDRWLSGDVA